MSRQERQRPYPIFIRTFHWHGPCFGTDRTARRRRNINTKSGLVQVQERHKEFRRMIARTKLVAIGAFQVAFLRGQDENFKVAAAVRLVVFNLVVCIQVSE